MVLDAGRRVAGEEGGEEGTASGREMVRSLQWVLLRRSDADSVFAEVNDHSLRGSLRPLLALETRCASVLHRERPRTLEELRNDKAIFIPDSVPSHSAPAGTSSAR